MTTQTEKLDSFNKILLATGTINYMASSVENVRVQCERMTLSKNAQEITKENGELLDEIVNDLKAVMEKLGNFINATDGICAIDQYVTTPAFIVVVNGNDDVEGDFDEL